MSRELGHTAKPDMTRSIPSLPPLRAHSASLGTARQFYLIPAGCTKDMQPIDQAAQIQDRGKKVISIKWLHRVVQETINEAWIKQVWAEVKRKATE